MVDFSSPLAPTALEMRRVAGILGKRLIQHEGMKNTLRRGLKKAATSAKRRPVMIGAYREMAWLMLMHGSYDPI